MMTFAGEVFLGPTGKDCSFCRLRAAVALVGMSPGIP